MADTVFPDVDMYFLERNNHCTAIFLQALRSADNLLCDHCHTIEKTFPAAALSIQLNARRIKNLLCLFVKKDEMNAAIEAAVAHVNAAVMKNIPGLGVLYLKDLHYGTTHEPCFHPPPTNSSSVPGSTPTPPNSPSPIPILDKGKGRQAPSPVTRPPSRESDFSISLPPSPAVLACTYPVVLEGIQTILPLAVTTHLTPTVDNKTGTSTPELSTPSESLFSDPPHSDPRFRNLHCRRCNTLGHRQSDCPAYFCRICRTCRPGHLTPHCWYKDEIKPHSFLGRIPHAPFNFITNIAKNPNFFADLDRWENLDDLHAKKIEPLLCMHTRRGVEPFTKEQSAANTSQQVVTLGQLKDILHQGHDEEHPIILD